MAKNNPDNDSYKISRKVKNQLDLLNQKMDALFPEIL